MMVLAAVKSMHQEMQELVESVRVLKETLSSLADTGLSVNVNLPEGMSVSDSESEAESTDSNESTQSAPF